MQAKYKEGRVLMEKQLGDCWIGKGLGEGHLSVGGQMYALGKTVSK